MNKDLSNINNHIKLKMKASHVETSLWIKKNKKKGNMVIKTNKPTIYNQDYAKSHAWELEMAKFS